MKYFIYVLSQIKLELLVISAIEILAFKVSIYFKYIENNESKIADK